MMARSASSVERDGRISAAKYFSNDAPSHILCWDLDGVLADGEKKVLLPEAILIVKSFDSRWIQCVTTASDSEYAYHVTRPLESVIQNVFPEISIPGGKDYSRVLGMFPHVKNFVAVGNEPTDVPKYVENAVFLYGSNLRVIRDILLWMNLLGLGDLAKGYEELKTSWNQKMAPAVFGEILGVRTVCVE